MAEGTITRCNAEKRYGFARLEDGGRLFVYRTEFAVPDISSFIQAGDRAAFDVYRTDKGAVATKVRVLE